jgi:hypothetical protein
MALPSRVTVMVFGELSFVGDISLLAIAGGVWTHWWDVQKERRKQRIDAYERLRKGFDEEPEFLEIFEALQAHHDSRTDQERTAVDEAMKRIDWRKRMRFAAFIENVALHAKSGIFSYELANYEFGYFARECWTTDSFWEALCDLGKKKEQEPLWTMVKEFVARIEPCNERLTADPGREVARLRI